MSDNVSFVLLQDKKKRAVVEARLLNGIGEEQLRDVENHWKPALAVGLQRLKTAGKGPQELPQSHHWNWRKKVEFFRSLLAYRGFAIECEGLTQGLMLVSTAEICRLPSQKGKPLVYVDYLETAPWNQRELVEQPRFGGIGAVMLAAAVQLSLDEGFYGRIGLHSLPQADKFYEIVGLARVENDPSKQGLCYFEMTPKQATAFLGKRGTYEANPG